jgi:hypothetical protein
MMNKKGKKRIRKTLRRFSEGAAAIALAMTMAAVASACCAGCAYLAASAARAGWGE